MNPIVIVRGETRTLKYQIMEDGVAKDITGMTCKLAVVEALGDAAEKIGPVDGAIDDAANGKISFTLTSTHTDQSAFAGVCGMALYDGSSNKTTLTAPGGLGFRLVEDIV